MIKRVNFTGRRRIPRDRVQIEVFDGQPRSFNAAINLEKIGELQRAGIATNMAAVRQDLPRQLV